LLFFVPHNNFFLYQDVSHPCLVCKPSHLREYNLAHKIGVMAHCGEKLVSRSSFQFSRGICWDHHGFTSTKNSVFDRQQPNWCENGWLLHSLFIFSGVCVVLV
jgi:hypothetical protein